MLLPPKLTFGPVWAAPLLIALFLVPLVALRPTRHNDGKVARVLSIGLIAALNVLNVVSIALLVADLVNAAHGAHKPVSAIDLLRNGALIWTTNIVVFALWYWELDADGPLGRARYHCAMDFNDPDFLFPQMQMDPKRLKGYDGAWKPYFIDYLYLSFTNALAVSPTDTLPLSRWAKMLMLLESLISFITVALILARSVNILS
ncbi:MAG: DUF1345 domain-containing protein [bacterium]|nr:DUF1345 domain-containing protein [bacterium]